MSLVTTLRNAVRSAARAAAAERGREATPAAGSNPSARRPGTVRWFNEDKGYGFVSDARGNQYFAHFSQIEGTGYRSLRAGEEVSFELKAGVKGHEAFAIRREAGADSSFEPAKPAQPARVDAVSERRSGKRVEGTVRFYNEDKGYGFITPKGGGLDVFVHYSALPEGLHDPLRVGQMVTFEVREGRKGEEARSVRPA